MGRLILTEQGHMPLNGGQPVTCWLWTKKELRAPKPAVNADASLWLYLQNGRDNTHPLIVCCNGVELTRIKAGTSPRDAWFWASVRVPRKCLKAGVNSIILSAKNPAAGGWLVGLDNRAEKAGSYVSFDRGKRWIGAGMGKLANEAGEFLIRLRCHSRGCRENQIRPVTYENVDDHRVRSLRHLIPYPIRRLKSPWKQLCALRAWIAGRWSHNPYGHTYAPWDPWTILDLAEGRQRNKTIMFCVHFGVVFAAFAASLGHTARCVVTTCNVNGPWGHFMVEVWDEERNKWVLHDPNYDIHYMDREPLSIVQLVDMACRSEKGFERFVRTGPAMPSKPKRLVTFFRRYLLTGKSFRIGGIWLDNNYVSCPAVMPPSHGATAYKETNVLWHCPTDMSPVEMFPYRTSNRQIFERQPSAISSRTNAALK